GERWGLASTLRGRAQLLTLDGRLTDAEAAYERALELAGEINSREDEGYLYGKLADLALRRGDIAAARRYTRQARSRADDHGAPLEGVFTLALLASVEQQAGNVDEARVLHAEAMRRVDALPREHMAHGHVRAILLGVGARLAYEDGDLDQAWEYARGSFEAARGTRDLPIMAAVSVGVAELVSGTDPARAAMMLGAAARLRGADDPTDRDISALGATLADQLGAERFAQLYAEGKSLDQQQAIERLAP
ncbi:MAG: hypothetical protein J0H43_10270, partial [Actinobacteria bacterium]|nr:hypothetical protein [Actinomycetota bacterium]